MKANKKLNSIQLGLTVAILLTLYSGCKQENEATAIVKDTYAGKPYRTFVTFQHYNLEQTGNSAESISNVRLEIFLPSGTKLNLPETAEYWPIGNAQTQEINRTFEIPWAAMRNDGFRMKVQMVRKGAEFLPCKFEVTQLSQFNRGYVCHTDIQWQLTKEHLTESTVDKEGIQVRVFTDMNSPSSEIPKDLARNR